jgi:hypothetical protein
VRLTGRRLAPSVAADARVADLVSGLGIGELADAGLVIGCVDTRRARMQLLGRCALADAPLLDGGTSPSGAELRLRVSGPVAGAELPPVRRGAAAGALHPAARRGPGGVAGVARRSSRGDHLRHHGRG